jgi:hypothetical protein
MGYYEDLHNLREGKSVPIVGPIEDYEDEDNEECEEDEYEEDECDDEPETVYPQTKPIDKGIDPEYQAYLEREYKEKQLEKLVNGTALVAGAVYVWKVLNEKS